MCFGPVSLDSRGSRCWPVGQFVLIPCPQPYVVPCVCPAPCAANDFQWTSNQTNNASSWPLTDANGDPSRSPDHLAKVRAMPAVRLEPKVWFSTERTFIHWAKLATVFAGAAAVLLTSSSSPAATISGLIVSLASVAILAHACLKQWRRNRIFKSGGKMVRVEDFADQAGALLLACCLTVVLLGMLAA
ncbi:unnamed protein product [Effrenium voratum]|nr:unnamed protein product [Effrenium voratum]